LGLKFEARKQMTDVLKIDHVAQPSGNSSFAIFKK